MIRHFLDLTDAGGDALAAMINDAMDRKEARAGRPKGAADDDAPLAGRVLAKIRGGVLSIATAGGFSACSRRLAITAASGTRLVSMPASAERTRSSICVVRAGSNVGKRIPSSLGSVRITSRSASSTRVANAMSTVP